MPGFFVCEEASMDFAEPTTTLARKRANLTKAFMADRERDRPDNHNISDCFTCGAGMVYHGRRFCSDRCRDFFDAGNAGHGQSWLQPKTDYGVSGWKVIAGPEAGSDPYAAFKPRDRRQGSKGVVIDCAGCAKPFDSTGLRCCSTACERRYREREENLKLVAEAGIQLAAKRPCAECGAPIPKWRNGRRVSSAARYCSPRCKQRAKTLPATPLAAA
jgi:hypothetical protein